ncbi:FKBP-type peptidyl-prolyl cis-trans isomerase [Streptomyces catenulae]|uniref:peptidylprolyl isomerase n=1 Tax=Streptomyces catenulae TaxID=66875 RepID=A0ABV2Z041_9ACTN|nr:FKBP-type peptidyl-prolyl cis-trans isomerase [Streptomyces catenulae]
MNLTKNTRRAAAAALTVPLLLFTAACGSDDKDAGKTVADVQGKVGDEPSIKVAKDAKVAPDLVTKTLVEGDGEKVGDGTTVRVDYEGKMVKGQSLGSSWEIPPGPGKDAKGGKVAKGDARHQIVVEMNDQLPQMQRQLPVPVKVLEALKGQKAGSRVQIEGTVKSFIGEVPPGSQLKADDGMVYVVDIAGAKKIDKKAKVEGAQAKPEDGMPEVKAEGEKAATITVPKGEKAPADLKQQVLVKGKGKGKEVKKGDALVAQYTGVKWEDGKKFDSSWDHGGATTFQIGTGSVIKGWDDALVGKHVGDRVEIVIPPKLGYGAQPQSELAKNTLVFSVDIVDAF